MTLEPTRIRLARERAALSRSALAASLGICEQELAQAPERLGDELAAALGCTPRFFHLPAASGIDTERIFFRSPRRTSTAQKRAAAAAGRTGVELYRLITQNFALPATEVPDLTGYSPADAAVQLRLDWQLGRGAPPDVLHLLESHGVRVLSLPPELEAVKTFSFWEDSQAYIFLASGSAKARRFALAHELGHLLLHSSLGAGSEQVAAAELEADQFAAQLLLPALSLQMRISDSLQIPQLLTLEAHFGVPATVILAHSRASGLLGEKAYCWLSQEIALEAPAPVRPVTSRVFSIVFPSLQLEHRASTSVIARELGLREQHIHELTFGQAFVVLAGQNEQEPGEIHRGHLRAL
ncbi:ImmA/IrrE family metallo-endopeptidase [Glutamicibacter halophytocola]|uniref:ImmA/IrrE family metallo-endopeptidase n=1 Tax=Glutamicibacter halophytocola TaxID=1933880 RepID=UPI003219EEAD